MISKDHVSTITIPHIRPNPILIENISPAVDGGRYPVKREVGDQFVVTADVFRDGHDLIRVDLQYREWFDKIWRHVPMSLLGNDLWTANILLDRNTRILYRVVAWPDRFGSWRDELQKKVNAGIDVESELREGRALLESVIDRDVSGRIETLLEACTLTSDSRAQVTLLLDDTVPAVVEAALDTDSLQTVSPPLEVVVDRVRARYAAWYEIFPRSAGATPGKSGTFEHVVERLDMIAEMGFDVLYFPPIHPIGEFNRKGPNNAVTSLPGDPGSPYAIGSLLGGHDAIHPHLGSLESFHWLVEEARSRNIEIALDFAIQAAPDHPWASEHPSWFHIRPDGTIKYAENPPKKYEDIYPINFSGEDWMGLWVELRRVFLYWIDQGVTIFRVDNPHTKPFEFWQWVIREIQNIHPEVIFLSEAFTRPKVMKALAKVGFTQSYSYFTWRNDKQGLTEYFEELTNPPVSEFMRANVFPTTPDILPFYLQQGGPAAFKVRLTLASTLSSAYGMYSGYELCEDAGIPGREEYINSEKYELKVWDWDRPGNIRLFVSRLNEIRREYSALHEYDNLQFHWSGNDNILCYSKSVQGPADSVLVVVNIDPFQAHDSMIYVPPDALGMPNDRAYVAEDLISGERYEWFGGEHYVRLDPAIEPVHILAFDHQ